MASYFPSRLLRWLQLESDWMLSKLVSPAKSICSFSKIDLLLQRWLQLPPSTSSSRYGSFHLSVFPFYATHKPSLSLSIYIYIYICMYSTNFPCSSVNWVSPIFLGLQFVCNLYGYRLSDLWVQAYLDTLLFCFCFLCFCVANDFARWTFIIHILRILSSWNKLNHRINPTI